MSTPRPAPRRRPVGAVGTAVAGFGLLVAAGLAGAGPVGASTDPTVPSDEPAAPATSVVPSTSEVPTTSEVAETPDVPVVEHPSGSGVLLVDVAGAAEAIMPSIVAISGDVADPLGPSTVTGTGVVVSADGAILTNAHVVDGVLNLRVRFDGDSEPVLAQVLAADVGNDLALIRVDRHDLIPARWAVDVTVGEPVIAVGFPLALDGDASVTLGIVSALGRTLVNDDGSALDGLIQTDAPISSGNSGGPLINADGEVVGINTAVPPGEFGMIINDIGFAIGVDEVRRVVPQLWEARHGETRAEGFLGVTVLGRVDGGQGVVLDTVERDGPAAAAGLLAGDIVVAIDGEAISGVGAMIGAIRDREPGDAMTISARRDGAVADYEVVLAERPAAG